MKLTDEEYKYIIEEFRQRCIDTMILKDLGKALSKKEMEHLIETYADSFDLTYIVTLLSGDIRQVLGRYRREKKE